MTDFESIAKAVGRNLAAFDFLVVADGSGSTYANPTGYYCETLVVKTGEVAATFGCDSNGTNNTAELNGVLSGLRFVRELTRNWRTKPHVLVISDSEVVVKGGLGEYGRHGNGDLWASVKHFEDALSIWWAHIPRNSHEIHSRADSMSKKARSLMTEFKCTYLSKN